jgi:hypothetical protein
MQDIQARRHRRIIGLPLGDRAGAASDGPARLPLDPDQGDVWEWENEGGAQPSDRVAERPTPRLARQG